MAVARYYDHDRGEWVLLAAGRDGASGASSWDDLTGKPATFPPESHTHSEYATTTSVNTLSAQVDGRPAFFSGAGAPPASIPNARVGDWWLNESTMELHKITAL